MFFSVVMIGQYTIIWLLHKAIFSDYYKPSTFCCSLSFLSVCDNKYIYIYI